MTIDSPLLHHTPSSSDLQPHLRELLNHYFSIAHLNDRLQDLPHQFHHPQPRPWNSIDWQAISVNQIVGIDPEVFLSILRGAINTEAPIRDYTQTSRQYLEPIDARMARFVGGVVSADGKLLEPGLWEKEERQHTPALLKVYTQLTSEKPIVEPHTVRAYQSVSDPAISLYRHGLHRVATEYGAACLYLWLMAQTTGALHAVLHELLLDEINHMAKFWGFGVWAYPNSSLPRVGWSLLQTTKGRMTYQRDRSSLVGTLDRMTQVLAWQTWSAKNRWTFALTCIQALHLLGRWNRTLTPTFLQDVLGASPCY
ncbi:MAG: ferritin-like domain-containing protein [Leptolyngbya sp. UWPOB_LEPTO1]|uniref:ferritin-like domain-containing protein n=1 Tax=Leptolyngbya sp. UWPOB_LEPTO1 TaxID=2815653 RepID=UPI001ACA13ED|nr:ferritin-like domain-containing protein [Leptolyngbya sp. UWPOB_LEPTO1]MBN8559292.1 ferritin-like domain-containing protein [Leptolyngbya sp. UWPOB_LEPTO1]